MSDTPRTDDKFIELDDYYGKTWYVVPVEFAQMLERELAAETKLKRDIANSRIIILKKITHCEHCGDSWFDSGISNASCPNCRIAELERERDALQAWKTTHRWHCACVFDGDDEEPTQECNYHAGLRENSSHVLSDLEAANTELELANQDDECIALIVERDALRKEFDETALAWAKFTADLIRQRDALRDDTKRLDAHEKAGWCIGRTPSGTWQVSDENHMAERTIAIEATLRAAIDAARKGEG